DLNSRTAAGPAVILAPTVGCRCHVGAVVSDWKCSMTEMTALRAHHRGGPEVLAVEPAPVPVPAAGEVLVEVHAAAITFDELTWDETWTRGGVDRTPIIPSHEISGVVAEIDSGATGFEPGDTVYGLIEFDRDGGAADYVTV